MKKYKTDIFTGMRPTSSMSIGNLIGVVEPTLRTIEDGSLGRPMVFVADLHSLTTTEPEDSQKNVIPVIKDYITAGLDPEKTDLFVQSQIADEVSKMTIYFSRLITVAELLRVPTLKEKIKKGQSEATANSLLAFYPVMMAADILLQGSKFVPVGKDQYVHLEVTCDLANRFNKKYGDVFLLPKPLEGGDPITVLSLIGSGKKMSKSEPSGAILLDDDIEVSLKKIKKAKTAFAGDMSEDLKSLKLIADYISSDEEKVKFESILQKHLDGQQVMGDFKNLLVEVLGEFLKDFQKKKASISDECVLEAIEKGGKKAKANAQEVLSEVENAMGMRYV
ncbi:TPA: tryptophan--tRNA ligase [Patescibacteria group bacterium]|nr:tryptophan--tRNA ligase [Patescibacteria group bacterium]